MHEGIDAGGLSWDVAEVEGDVSCDNFCEGQNRARVQSEREPRDRTGGTELLPIRAGADAER
ncbi:hypothetical protein NEUTE2DRAFT_58449 [Neurospora tetrasperma FGSC 2509]|nr:hypothetical protein NEUTE2DRAFT_58449 [Neurospora tetrasperma FGSC 2509]